MKIRSESVATCRALVFTQVRRYVLVPEGRQRLAGGGTTGVPSAQSPSTGRCDRLKIGLLPLPWLGSLSELFPVVEPPERRPTKFLAPQERQNEIGLSPLPGLGSLSELFSGGSTTGYTPTRLRREEL